MSYYQFLAAKQHTTNNYGFEPLFLPDNLFDFQKSLVNWAMVKGRAAIFADCGMGKTAMQLVWAENIVKTTNKPVLVLTPLAVGFQTVEEANKFGVEAARSADGKVRDAIVYVTNYEKLHYFDPADFAGVVCDESSCIKNFDGVRSSAITEFMKKTPYRLLCTATAAPNDFIELGTSSEALGEMGYMDMLSRWFKHDSSSTHPNRLSGDGKWRFKGHSERDFWRWVCSWARAVRKPSDLGFDDGSFVLPDLITEQHIVESSVKRTDMLFDFPAEGLKEQREERRRSLPDRCNKVAELIADTSSPAVAWCHLNDESEMICNLIPDAVEIAGKHTDQEKEDRLLAFARGDIRVLVTKPQMAGFGLNWQHCSHMTFFPSHSFEQYYQGVRRCWRFGQKNKVKVDVVTSKGEANVLRNLQRKANQAEDMFARLVELMNSELTIKKENRMNNSMEIPQWLS